MRTKKIVYIFLCETKKPAWDRIYITLHTKPLPKTTLHDCLWFPFLWFLHFRWCQLFVYTLWVSLLVTDTNVEWIKKCLIRKKIMKCLEYLTHTPTFNKCPCWISFCKIWIDIFEAIYINYFSIKKLCKKFH